MSERLKQLQDYLADYDFYSTSPIGPYVEIDKFRMAVQELTAAQSRVAELTAQCDDKETRLLAAARKIASLEVELNHLTATNSKITERIARN